jgi:hypothetical protein
MNQLSQNVDVPTCEVIVEHGIVDARTLQVKVQPLGCGSPRPEDEHEQRSEAQQRPNFF